MTKQLIQTTSATATKELGKNIAREIIKEPIGTNALVFALKGELGGGKTTFVQGLAEGLGVKERVLSPTFLIVKEFPLSKGKRNMLYHIDCYRISSPQELLDLGFSGILSDPRNVVVVEWADRVRSILPKDTRWIRFVLVKEDTREIMIQ